MAVNLENVKKAFELFQDKKFTDADDLVRYELRSHLNDKMKEKLGLRGDVFDFNSSKEE